MKRKFSLYAPGNVSNFKVNQIIKDALNMTEEVRRFIDIMFNFETIERLFKKEYYICIYTNRPGIIIGYHGQVINKIKEELNKVIPGIKVKVVECHKV